MDPYNYADFRLFRSNCEFYQNTYIKDLSKMGRNIHNIIIIDNSPLSYSLQPENGIPITTWVDDQNDLELIKLIPILVALSHSEDVRQLIRKIVIEDKVNFALFSEIYSIYSTYLTNKSIYKNKNQCNCNYSPAILIENENKQISLQTSKYGNCDRLERKIHHPSNNDYKEKEKEKEKERPNQMTNFLQYKLNEKKRINPFTLLSKTMTNYEDESHRLNFNIKDDNFIETVFIPRKENKTEYQMNIQKKSNINIQNNEKYSFTNLQSIRKEGIETQPQTQTQTHRRNKSIPFNDKNITKSKYQTHYVNSINEANCKNIPLQRRFQKKNEYYHSLGC